MNYITGYFVIYLIGSYIRLYPNKVFKDKSTSIICCLISILICIVRVIRCLWIGEKINVNAIYYYIADSNKILAVITSVFLFLTFKNINIKTNKIINAMAESIFGVLLIHANSDTMRKFLWKDFLHNTDIYSLETFKVILHSIGCTLAIFAICTLVDQLRSKLIEKILFNKIGNKIEKMENILLNKYEYNIKNDSIIK